ncbi:MAG: restriction endonuclease subunit S [Erysipelotrichaceae bacterium]|nr:restriction endonuclease subunit S [Erysipelotrichaceae bacterium]
MSKIEKLIAELCPDGVEYKKVKNVYRRLRGTPITAEKMKEIDNPGGEIRVFAGGKTVINAREEDIPQSNITRAPAVLVQSRGVIDAIYYEEPFTFKNEMWAYTADDKKSVKYLYYVLKNNIQQFRDAASGMGSLPQISLKVTEDFLIPLPPLPVQQEIVRILDNFTELTAELTARKKQYEYYRESLMKDKNFEWKSLNEVGIMKRGTYVTKKSIGAGNIPVILGGQQPAYYCDSSNHDGEAIVISRSGAYAGFISFWNEPIFVTDGFIIETRNRLKLKFLYYYLRSIQNSLHQSKRGGGVPHVRGSEIMKIKVPVPPLEEQERIIAILDRFDTLSNDLTSGLPAEIEARRKQYEYYRDQLLTFKEASA